MSGSLQGSHREGTMQRDKNESPVQIDFNLGQASGCLITGHIFPMYLSPVQFEKNKFPGVIQSPVYKEAQLHGNSTPVSKIGFPSL